MKKVVVVCCIVMAAVFSAALSSYADGDYTTEVTVYKNGEPRKGIKVSLEFTGLMGGLTDSYYTDSSGTAYVKHSSKGEVKVYVDGNWSKHQTKGKAPGRINVYITD
ncbi:MAG: hypothetical protein HQK63_07655 [Desulfamplus sp.]|nr:hypothetical protein [Desulfamplus sp.]